MRHVVIAATAAILFTAAAPSVSAQQGEWVPLPPRVQSFDLEGQRVEVPIQSEARIDADGADWTLRLRAVGGLADFQAKVPALLHALAAKHSSSDCGDKFEFPELGTPVADDGRLKLTGRLSYSRCLLGGLLTTIGGPFELHVWPVHSETQAGLRAEIIRLEVVGLESLLKPLLQAELDRALGKDDARLNFPQEVLPFSPRFNNAAIGGAGMNGELVLEAQAKLALADLPRLIQMLAQANP